MPIRRTGALVNRNMSSAVAVTAASMDAVPVGSERILVIEDDRAVQKALKRLFEGEGFAVDIAGNGAAGLEMFRAAAPSVLVLDLSLPGTPGQDVCREIEKALGRFRRRDALRQVDRAWFGGRISQLHSQFARGR